MNDKEFFALAEATSRDVIRFLTERKIPSPVGCLALLMVINGTVDKKTKFGKAFERIMQEFVGSLKEDAPKGKKGKVVPFKN